jgi:hypothetical protein
MDILLAFIFGTAWGLIAHYALPGRDLRGQALPPVAGAVSGGLVWLLLTWAGMTTADPWIWLASIAVPALVVFAGTAILTRIRRTRDVREAERLKIA